MRKLILLLVFTGASTLCANPIADEIHMLKTQNRDVLERNKMKNPVVKSFIDSVDITKYILTLPEQERLKVNFFLNVFPGSLLKAAGLILLTPERAPKLHVMVDKLCKKLTMQKPVLFLAGKKKLFNAFASSLAHSMSMVVLGQELVNELTEEESEAIIAHELGHIKNHHPPKKMGLLAAGAIGSLLSIALINKKIDQHYDGNIPPTVKFVSFLSGFSIVLLTLAILNYFSRKFEREADAIAVEISNPHALANALKKFKKRMYAEEEFQFLQEEIDRRLQDTSPAAAQILKQQAQATQKGYNGGIRFADKFPLIASHPPIDERIATAEAHE